MPENSRSRLRDILDRAASGERLWLNEAESLLTSPDILALGRAAAQISQKLHPENRVTFVIDRNINYTNVCTMGCRFCAFHRPPGAPDAYLLSREEVFAKIEEAVGLGATQVLMQGGIHPDLGLEWFLDLFRAIRARYRVHIHSLSPPEVQYLARSEGLSVPETICALRNAGLDSIPGGGAEILDDRVRREISPRKIGWEDWMEVMETAHGLGMKTTATMMFGSVETPRERALHLLRLRDAQDRALKRAGINGGFTAFIPWSFQPANTALGGYPAGGFEYLRILAASRLILDNIPNIQASWVTQGPKVAQVALAFGANDFGGTMIEENVVRAAGVAHRVPMGEIISAIRSAGFIPAQRDTYYNILREWRRA